MGRDGSVGSELWAVGAAAFVVCGEGGGTDGLEAEDDFGADGGGRGFDGNLGVAAVAAAGGGGVVVALAFWKGAAPGDGVALTDGF